MRRRKLSPEVIEQLRVLIVDKGMTREAAAERARITPSTVYFVAAKERWPLAERPRGGTPSGPWGLKPDAKPIAPDDARYRADMMARDARFLVALGRELEARGRLVRGVSV